MSVKRSIDCLASSSSDGQPKQAKRQVSVATSQKWQSQQEKEHKALSWLRCDKQQKHVERLWCEICRRLEDKICGVKNFSAAWIAGYTNQKLSNVLDHAQSEQHKPSMSLLSDRSTVWLAAVLMVSQSRRRDKYQWLPLRNGNHSKKKSTRRSLGYAVISNRNTLRDCGVKYAEDSKTRSVGLRTSPLPGSLAIQTKS